MKKYFLSLYGFNAWANDRVVSELKKQSVADEKMLSLMGHVLAAQFIWLHRIKGLPPPPLQLWSQYTIDELGKMATGIGKQWLEYVQNTESFDRDLNYKNFVGDPFINNVEMIMIHVVNHSSYHRAQVALLMRERGFEPINTDFITYDRVVRGQLKG